MVQLSHGLVIVLLVIAVIVIIVDIFADTCGAWSLLYCRGHEKDFNRDYFIERMPFTYRQSLTMAFVCAAVMGVCYYFWLKKSGNHQDKISFPKAPLTVLQFRILAALMFGLFFLVNYFYILQGYGGKAQDVTVAIQKRTRKGLSLLKVKSHHDDNNNEN